MPGICKVGKTERNPIERLKDANSDTWSPPVWKCEIAKYVKDVSKKEMAIHRVLEDMSEHISRREMFKISAEKVRRVFDLMDEETTQENIDSIMSNPTSDIIHTGSDIMNIKKIILKNAGCRNQKKCFTDGQSIRHTIPGVGDIWNAIYRKTSNTIEYESIGYKSLTEFVSKHYEHQGIKPPSIKAWQECECFLGERWISTYNLPVHM